MIASLTKPVDGAAAALRNATAFGRQRGSSEDLEFAVRQLVEVAVRALSPGINDPHTAMSVLDRLGAALCDLAERELPEGVTFRQGRCVLDMRRLDYDGLTDTMFHMIRQSARGGAAVLIRFIDVLTAVASVEPGQRRRATLSRHAALARDDAMRDVRSASDLADIHARYARFAASMRAASLPSVVAADA